jgi:hypothetical protein
MIWLAMAGLLGHVAARAAAVSTSVMTITSVEGYGLLPGGRVKAVTPESRVLGVKVGLSCEFGSGSHFELVEAAQKLLQLGDPALGAGPDNLEHPRQPRTV